jgi:hypothetical protein
MRKRAKSRVIAVTWLFARTLYSLRLFENVVACQSLSFLGIDFRGFCAMLVDADP